MAIMLWNSPCDASHDVCCYINGQVLRDHQWVEEPLWVQEGKIIEPQDKAEHTIDVEGMLIAPGYIDLQINGAFGVDFSSDPNRVHEAAKQLPQFGVTAFCPTVVTSSREIYPSIINALEPTAGSAKNGAAILGSHLEGPFFSPSQVGAHRAELIAKKGEEDPESVFGSLKSVKLVTMAPEIPEALSMIPFFNQNDVIVSVGHSQASCEEVTQAQASGAKMVTHLFNAMTPFHHRAPGIVGAVLGDRTLNFSLIADGIHVHPSTVRAAWNSHSKGLILVTDAMAALGLPKGKHKLGEMTIEVRDDAAYVDNSNTLAGSMLGMDQAVRNLKQFTGCSNVEAIEAATLHPADLLGIEKSKGSLNIGCDADFLLLNSDLIVQACYLAGEKKGL